VTLLSYKIEVQYSFLDYITSGLVFTYMSFNLIFNTLAKQVITANTK